MFDVYEGDLVLIDGNWYTVFYLYADGYIDVLDNKGSLKCFELDMIDEVIVNTVKSNLTSIEKD